MILVHCRPLPETRTQNSAAAWLAEAEVDGRHFSARSRHGAPNALARELVAAGIPDQPLEIHYDGLAGTMRYPSLHAAAGWTYTEGVSTPLSRTRWRAFRAAEPIPPECPPLRIQEGQNEGGSSAADQSVTQAPEPPKMQSCTGCGQEFRPSRKWSTFCSNPCRQQAYRRRRAASEAA